MSVEALPEPVRQRLGSATRAVIWSAFLLRCGQSAATVIIGFYLESLRRGGVRLGFDIGPQHFGAAIVASLLLSSSYFWELLVAPIMGALSDRYGRKPFIILGPLIGLIGIQVYPLSGILGVLFLARALEGVSAATLTPATLGFLADTTAGTNEARGRTMAYYEIAVLVGIGSGYALGGFMWQALGIHAFRSAGGLYLLSILVVWVWVSHTWQIRHTERIGLADYLSVMRQPRVLRFAPAWLCVTAVIGLWFNNVVFQLAGPRRAGQLLTGGMTGGQVSLIMGMFVLVLIVGTFGWSRLFGRFRFKTTIMFIALCGMFVVCLDLLVLNHRGNDSIWWFAGLLPILGISIAVESGFTPAALAYLADITEDFKADRGVIMGLYSIILSVGAVTGGVAGGPFAQAWGLDGMIFLTLMLAVAAMVTMVLLQRADALHRLASPTQPKITPESSPAPA